MQNQTQFCAFCLPTVGASVFPFFVSVHGAFGEASDEWRDDCGRGKKTCQ